MFLAQLAQFLTAHHHAHAAMLLPVDPPAIVAHWHTWAVRHGFVYQP